MTITPTRPGPLQHAWMAALLALPAALAPAGRAAAQPDAIIVEEAQDAAEAPRERQRPSRLAGHTELPLGRVIDGNNTGGRPAAYRFTAEGPGLLTVAVRAKTGEDMTIQVNNDQGGTMPNGDCDIDYNGDVGSEHLTVPIPEAGDYEVLVPPLSNGGPFWIGASWLAVADLADLAPKKPENVIELISGASAQATAVGNAQAFIWFSFTAPAEGMLIFDTRAQEQRGDLVLEAYLEGNYMDAFYSSDQDRGRNSANELLTIDLEAGQTIYIKAYAQSSAAAEFTARARFMGFDAEDAEDAAQKDAAEPAAPARNGAGR